MAHERCHRRAAPGPNAVIKFVNQGRLEEVEQAARALLEHHPDVHDGSDRLGMDYEARHKKTAAACYRKVIAFVNAHQDQYGPTFMATFEQMVSELDPPTT